MGVATAGYAALFLPAFGGVDLTDFRHQWGWLCWLDAVTFTILSAACTIDLAVKAARIRERIRRQRERNRYFKIYAPLFSELMKIQITTSSATLRPYFSQRAERAWRKLRTTKRTRVGMKVAWQALFDKQITKETGEVEYGGDFPIEEIDRMVHQKLTFCDEELLDLTSRAVIYRREERVSSGQLTYRDVLLYDHIVRERSRLKKRLTG
jgi:hypothetical protein